MYEQMKTKQLYVFLLLCGIIGAQAQTQIITHRGYWDKLGSAQNSLSSLNNAINMGAYGSELDVWITKDGVIVLNHGDSYQGVLIQTATFEELSKLSLVNGEPIPTLQQCIDVAKKQTKTKLIVEIKPHDTAENDVRVAAETVKLIDESGMAEWVDYISFSENVCKELIRLNPRHRVAYLNGEKSPEELKAEGYWGLDYAWDVLKEKHPGWIEEANKLGLTTNVWTVNEAEQMQYFISQGIHYITTDNPQLLKGLLTTILQPPLGTVPAGNGNAPIGNGNNPIDNGNDPIGNGNAPIGNGNNPIDNGNNPIDNGNDPSAMGTIPNGIT
jgi:glycerophosphoryl diester phosphodiesterase